MLKCFMPAKLGEGYPVIKSIVSRDNKNHQTIRYLAYSQSLSANSSKVKYIVVTQSDILHVVSVIDRDV